MTTSRAITCAGMFIALLATGAAAATPLHGRKSGRSLPLVASALRVFQASLIGLTLTNLLPVILRLESKLSVASQNALTSCFET